MALTRLCQRHLIVSVLGSGGAEGALKSHWDLEQLGKTALKLSLLDNWLVKRSGPGEAETFSMIAPFFIRSGITNIPKHLWWLRISKLLWY